MSHFGLLMQVCSFELSNFFHENNLIKQCGEAPARAKNLPSVTPRSIFKSSDLNTNFL